MDRVLKLLNLSLLILFPVAWSAPLLRAGLLPLFKLNEVTVLSGIQALWKTDVVLALLVVVFAIVAPIAKTLGIAALQHNRLNPRLFPVLNIAGKLAMADIFLIAIYIVIIKGGIGVGRVETAWGLYLFTFCVLLSFSLGQFASYRAATSHPNITGKE